MSYNDYPTMSTNFVESCIDTAAGSAVAVERRTRRHPRAHQLLRLMKDKKNILVTTHEYPDPDALAACIGLATLLRHELTQTKVRVSFKGRLGGGLNCHLQRLERFQRHPLG